MEAPTANRAAADATATNFVCFLIMNALSFLFFEFLLKFLWDFPGSSRIYGIIRPLIPRNPPEKSTALHYKVIILPIRGSSGRGESLGELLCLLSKNVGKVLTHTFITQNIWGRSWENDVASLRVFMATLRKKLEPKPDSPQYIQTHIGVGYRMMKVE